MKKQRLHTLQKLSKNNTLVNNIGALLLFFLGEQMKVKKTNAMRILDQHKISYDIETYAFDEDDVTGKKYHEVKENTFKTLVLKGEKKGYMVCCIPSSKEIDLKKLAIAVGDKKVEMIPMKDLLQVTGYIRGGCSPIGMKKKFTTIIDESCRNFTKIAVSAGQRGMQVILNTSDLLEICDAKCGNVIK